MENPCESSEIRKNDSILDLAKDLSEGEIPAIWYHRTCVIEFSQLINFLTLSLFKIPRKKLQIQVLEYHLDHVPYKVYKEQCIFSGP